MHQTCAIAFFFFSAEEWGTKKGECDGGGVSIILICGHKTKFELIRKNSCRFHTGMDHVFFFFSFSRLSCFFRWSHNIATRMPMN